MRWLFTAHVGPSTLHGRCAAWYSHVPGLVELEGVILDTSQYVQGVTLQARFTYRPRLVVGASGVILGELGDNERVPHEEDNGS